MKTKISILSVTVFLYCFAIKAQSITSTNLSQNDFSTTSTNAAWQFSYSTQNAASISNLYNSDQEFSFGIGTNLSFIQNNGTLDVTGFTFIHNLIPNPTLVINSSDPIDEFVIGIISPQTPSAYITLSNITVTIGGVAHNVIGTLSAATNQFQAIDIQLGQIVTNFNLSYNISFNTAGNDGSAVWTAGIEEVPYRAQISGGGVALTDSQVALTAAVLGRRPMSYQWQFDGGNIAGATNTSLVFNSVQVTNSGAYTVIASNAFGITTNSVPASLTVVDIGVFADGNLVTNQPYTAQNYSYISLASLYTNGYIFYTLDGSDPDFTGIEYTSPFYIYNSCTIRAIAYNADFSEYVEADPAVISIIPTYQLSILNYGGGTVSVNPASEDGEDDNGYYSFDDYLSNSVVTLVATPSNGSTFMGWSGALNGNNLTNSIIINQDTSVQAIFGTSLNPTNIGNGTLSVYPATSIYPFGYTVQVTATPSPGNCFVQWQSGASGSMNPLNLTITSTNSIITGIFAALPTNKVSLTVLSDGGGYVTVNPSANIYLKGTTNILTAIANSGQKFIGWSGDVIDTTNVVSVVMNQSKSITAHFSHYFAQNFTQLGTNLQFSISGGGFGDTYMIMTSTNLSSWTPINTNIDFFDPVYFFDSIDKNVQSRFFKVIAQ